MGVFLSDDHAHLSYLLLSYIRHPHTESIDDAMIILQTGVQDFIFSQCGMHIDLKFQSYNLLSKNLVHNGVDLYV